LKVKKGFTLIEVIVAITIFAIAMVGISLALTTSMTMQIKSRSQYDVNNYAKGIIEYLKVSSSQGAGQYRIYFNDVGLNTMNIDSLQSQLQSMSKLSNSTNLNTIDVNYFKINQGLGKSYNFGAFIDINKSSNVEFGNLYKMTIILCDLKENKMLQKEYYIDR
jgi:prepilin-type N-terminal cleavage/methylation domain-containing protein